MSKISYCQKNCNKNRKKDQFFLIIFLNLKSITLLTTEIIMYNFGPTIKTVELGSDL